MAMTVNNFKDKHHEGNPPHSDPSNSSETLILECAVCLQTYAHPVQLPCDHIFCFLCVKGVLVNLDHRCPLCRMDIPAEFLENPKLINYKPDAPFNSQGPEVEEQTEVALPDSVTPTQDQGAFQWFYEGSHGWWQYDEQTSGELEDAHRRGSRKLKLLIAGYIYIIVFENMCQYRQNDPSKQRRIKRDFHR